MNDAVQANHQAPLEIRIVRYAVVNGTSKRAYRVDLYNRATEKQRQIIAPEHGLTHNEAKAEATSLFAFMGTDVVMMVGTYEEVPRTGNDYVPVVEQPVNADVRAPGVTSAQYQMEGTEDS